MNLPRDWLLVDNLAGGTLKAEVPERILQNGSIDYNSLFILMFVCLFQRHTENLFSGNPHHPPVNK